MDQHSQDPELMEARKQEHHDLIDNVEEETKAVSLSISKPVGLGNKAYIDSISDEILIGSS